MGTGSQVGNQGGVGNRVGNREYGQCGSVLFMVKGDDFMRMQNSLAGDPEEKTGLPPIYVGAQILDMREPDWLLPDFIQEGGLTVIYGPPGGAKSLVMMDWANVLSAAGGGWKWFGRERERRTTVLYVLGEGQGGLKGRVLAWMKHRQLETMPDVQWMLEPMSLWRRPGTDKTDEQRALLDYIRQEQIGVVFVDTLARTFGGGNENMQQDMNVYLSMIGDIQEMGASVVLAHHVAKSTGEMRGSTALRAAADTAIKMCPDFSAGRLVKVKMVASKQKDGIPFEPMTLAPVQFDVDTKTGSSIALDFSTSSGSDSSTFPQKEFYDRVAEILEYGRKKLSWRDLRNALSMRYEKAAELRDQMLEDGFLVQDEDAGFFTMERLEDL